MAQVTATLTTPWGLGAALWAAAVVTPWGTGSAIWSTGGSYTPGSPPGGGTPTAPGTGAGLTVSAAAAYNLAHTLDVRDLRDDSVLPVDRVSISTDRDSIVWTLRASGGAALFARLSTGQQPPRVRVVVDGAAWEFVLESVVRTRQHPGAQVSIEGRSLACAAGAPYQAEQTWAVEGDTTAAQIATAANLYTELDVQWAIDDWPVPEGVFSFVGTPLAVVRRVAEAAGAVAQSLRTGYGVTVRPRYALLPNEWASAAPELELPLAVVETESFQLDEQPPYDGVVVAGQQQGVIGLVRLAGTSGAFQAPMVTDVLITDAIAVRQRGQATLGRSGQQQIHSIRLPVVSAGGVAVVPDPGWLVRVMDTPSWVGLVTAVQLDVELPSAAVTLTLERHTKLIDGTAAAPPIEDVLGFSGTVPNISVATGASVDVALAAYFTGGEPPLRFSMRSGSLPAWLALVESTGRLVGTAPGSPESSTVAVRATDSIDSTADSNEFQIAVVATESPSVLVIDAPFSGTNGQTTGIANAGTLGGTLTCLNAALSTSQSFSAPSSLLLVDDTDTGAAFTGYSYGPVAPTADLVFRLYASSGISYCQGGVSVGFSGTAHAAYFEAQAGVVRFSLNSEDFSGTGLALNTWHKVRLLRSNAAGRLYLYVNDTLVQDVAVGSLPATQSFNAVAMGIDLGAGAVYLDNLQLQLLPL